MQGLQHRVPWLILYPWGGFSLLWLPVPACSVAEFSTMIVHLRCGNPGMQLVKPHSVHYCGSTTRNILIVLNPVAVAPTCPYMEVGACCGFVEECALKPYKYIPQCSLYGTQYPHICRLWIPSGFSFLERLSLKKWAGSTMGGIFSVRWSLKFTASDKS